MQKRKIVAWVLVTLLSASNAAAQPAADQIKLCQHALQAKRRILDDQLKLRGVDRVDQDKLEANLTTLRTDIAALEAKCGASP